ncbi:hypothetical protein KWH43_17050 [Xanthomonas campestris pv. heliotropii]|nr:hypothetical protein [Xanthomonas campestris pv. heliotropii]
MGWLYIPANSWAPTFKTYSDLIGTDATAKLVRAYAGEQIEVNEPGSWLDAHRNRSILRTWTEDQWISTERVGWLHGVTGRHVRNIVRGTPRCRTTA